MSGREREGERGRREGIRASGGTEWKALSQCSGECLVCLPSPSVMSVLQLGSPCVPTTFADLLLPLCRASESAVTK